MNDVLRMTPEKYRQASACSARRAALYDRLLTAVEELIEGAYDGDPTEIFDEEMDRLLRLADEQRADAEHFRVLAAALDLDRRVQ